MTAYLSALAVCATSITVGAALSCRSREWSWTGPPVGLAAVMLLALAAVRLPGHGTTAAVAIALATIASAFVVARRGVRLAPLAAGLPVAGAVLVACSLPFIVNDRIGELGAWINDDLSVHMAQADALRTLGPAAHITSSGYPNGPHAVVAALASGLGVGPSAAFTGLLLATPVLTALTALAALDGARWYLRMPAAALTGVPYLAVSYLAQGAFKEPLLALLFLGFVLALREAYGSGRSDARLALALLLTAAAGVAVFGIAALAWPAAALLWLGALELLHGRRPQLSRRQTRLLPAVAGLAVAAVTVAGVAGGGDFFDTGPGRYITAKQAGGNFLGQLSPLEAVGVWRQPDFRFSPGSPLLEPGILLGCAVVVFGLLWCWRRREWALLAGALGGISLYVVARPFTLAYFSGKALAVVAPLLTLVAVKALVDVASRARLGAGPQLTPAPLVATAVLAVYVVLAGASSALALRGAHVRPSGRGHDLAAFRSVVDGEPTVYLGRDNFVPWELRGAELRGFQSYDTPLALGIDDAPEKYAGDARPPAVDVDSVDFGLLAGARYLVTPRTAYASRPPANFRPIRRTRWHVLWERRGPTRPRNILAEGEAPGKVLDCGRARGRELARTPGAAYVRPPPVIGHADAWLSGAGRPAGEPGSVQNGDSRFQELQLAPGSWEISLRYFSDVALRVRAGSLDTSLPAYVADLSTFAGVGRVVTDGGPLRVTVSVPARQRIETLRTAKLGTLVATRVDDRGALVGLARACGRYVDWFRVGAEARD
ncbi:MAG: hypothetical protein H0T69_16830 [Thermoleophilaceae bacterium]|nr:hypothetical protein [Thermoleophilaceae bacterium]